MVKLQEIAQLRTGLVLQRKKVSFINKNNFNYYAVSLKDFNETAIYTNKFVDEFITNEPIKEEYFVKKGDILLRLREPNFAVFIDSDYNNLLYNSLVVNIKVIDSRFDARFLAYFLNSSVVKRILTSKVSGTAIPMIRLLDIKELTLPFLQLDTQIKIAKYLKFSYQETKLLQELIEKKQKFSKQIFKKILSKGN